MALDLSLEEQQQRQLAHPDEALPPSSSPYAISAIGNAANEIPLKRHKLFIPPRTMNCVTSGSSSSAMKQYSSPNLEQDLSPNLERGLSQNLLPGVIETSAHMESLNTGEENEGCHTGQGSIDHHEVKLDLTDDIIHMVFSLLDNKTLCKAGLACRQWHAASVHDDFWRCLNFENCRITAEQVAQMCRRYPRAVELHLPGFLLDPVRETLRPVRESLHTLRNLKLLTIDQGTLSDAFFKSVARCPVLNCLIITEAISGRGGTQEIHIRHESLRHLKVIRCHVHRIFVRCPLLETLSLKRSDILSAILSCPLLRELDVASCHKLSDPGVRVAAISCPLLQSLDISNCSYVSDDTLREIAAACTDLRFLDASYCPNISLEAVRMPRLVELRLHNCEGINATSMASLSQCLFLEALQLDFCWLLISVTLDLPRLRHISLVNCRKIVELNLYSPALVSINVTSCPILNRVDIKSTALEKLVLQKQQSLTTIMLQCLCLSEVDLTECESLTDSICEVFRVGGGCPMLNTLILDGCESLSNVNLNSISLHTLSLTGCLGLTNLQLACPSLQKICLDGCDHLEGASFSPVGLCSLNLGICAHLTKLEIRAPQLTALELKGCGVLSQADIDCPQLHSLEASFCRLLNDYCLAAATGACPSIRLLVLMSCTSIETEGLLALQRLSNLTLLDMSYTYLTNLQPIFDSCPQLKVLKLQACKYLANTALIPLHKGRALANLCELDLSYTDLNQSAIEELLAWCPHLTHLSLNGCVNMHDLDWRFWAGNSYGESEPHRKQNKSDLRDYQINVEGSPNRSLQHLNCVGCANIKKVVIPASAQCMNLSSLNFSLSANIQEVNLSCFNLTTLNLSNCTSLETLQLDCPHLTSLSLQACRITEQELECIIQSCNLLETLDVRLCPKISSTGIAKLCSISPVLK